MWWYSSIIKTVSPPLSRRSWRIGVNRARPLPRWGVSSSRGCSPWEPSCYLALGGAPCGMNHDKNNEIFLIVPPIIQSKYWIRWGLLRRSRRISLGIYLPAAQLSSAAILGNKIKAQIHLIWMLILRLTQCSLVISIAGTFATTRHRTKHTTTKTHIHGGVLRQGFSLWTQTNLTGGAPQPLQLQPLKIQPLQC